MSTDAQTPESEHEATEEAAPAAAPAEEEHAATPPTPPTLPPLEDTPPTVIPVHHEEPVAAPVAQPSLEAAEPGQFKLVIEQGLSINKEFLLSEPDQLLGRRDPEQDFIPDIDLFDQETPNNRYISRRQAHIYFKEGGLWLEDLDSSNGTALNNHLIKPHSPLALSPGDKILLGQSVLLRLRRLK